MALTVAACAKAVEEAALSLRSGFLGWSQLRSFSGVDFAALDERLRAAWEASTLLSATEVLGALTLAEAPVEDPAQGPPLSLRELNAALALCQQLLARQRDETEHWRAEAGALKASRLELARTREVLTHVCAERDALRVRLQDVADGAAPLPTEVRREGHSGLLRAAAEEMKAHSAAREAAAIAAEEALCVAQAHASATTQSAAERLRARMLSGEQDGQRSAE